MKLVDLIILAVVLGGLAIVLYKTMWKPKTLCPGCDGCDSGSKETDRTSCPSGGCK